MLPEEVPLHLETLRAVGYALVNSKEESAIVVFEDLALDRRREGVREFDAGNDFQEHGAEGQERTYCRAESGVFGLKGGQGNLALEVTLPQNGAPAEGDDVASSGLRGAWRTVGIATVETCEVGVDITVEIQGAGGLHNHAHFARALQIANKSLDGGGVTFLLAVTEPGDLADGEYDVGASVGGKVEQHSHNGAVAPRFFHGRTVGINSESGLRGGRPVVVAAVGHSGCLLDFLDESFLGESEGSFFRILGEIDAEEVGEGALASKVETLGFKVREELLDVVFVAVGNI